MVNKQETVKAARAGLGLLFPKPDANLYLPALWEDSWVAQASRMMGLGAAPRGCRRAANDSMVSAPLVLEKQAARTRRG